MNEIERLQKTILDSQIIIIDAKYKLGCCYIKGKGVKQDCKKAFKYFQLAAKDGNVNAMCNVGTCYFKGEGVEQNEGTFKESDSIHEVNFDKAFKYFEKAADRGFVPAKQFIEKRKRNEVADVLVTMGNKKQKI